MTYPLMLVTHTDVRGDELRREAAQARLRGMARRASVGPGRSLRTTVGFWLVEAGLRLVATRGAHPPNPGLIRR